MAAMNRNHPYPIGTPGSAWGAAERAAWLARQSVRRSYADDVLAAVEALRADFECVEYLSLIHI